MVVAGDFFGGGLAADAMNQSASTFIDQELINQFKAADVAILNLESPLTEHNKTIIKSGPAIKANAVVANRIKEMGITLVTLANNHIMDFGNQGLRDTLATLDSIGLSFTGAGFNQEHARKPYILTIANKKLAVLNFCENEWSTTHGSYMGANPINEIENFYQIRKAKEQADYILVIAHGGHERYPLPSPRIKRLYRFFADAGASAVVAHHTHCTSGYEVYNNIPIIYGLGNFLFANKAMKKTDWNNGMTVTLNFETDLCTFDFTHFDQCKDQVSVQVVSVSETKVRNEKIKELNKIIASNDQLKENYQRWLSSNFRMYSAYLEPHANRYIQYLQNRKLFPSFWARRKRTYLLNLIRCEAHRDAVISLLEDENSHS